MQVRKIGFDLSVFLNLAELPDQDQELMRAAMQAREGAYAPYSDFRVGAALLLASGEILIGSNQENASYPSGLCAERVAVFQAGARFPGIHIQAIAIAASPNAEPASRPSAPCGNCRQAIAEYEYRQQLHIPILMMGSKGEVFKSPSIAALLPLGFDASYLK